MAKVFIEETTLTAIGDAIRGKEGSSELVPVNDMASRITDLPSGGGGGEAEPIKLTGDCDCACAGPLAGNYLNMYGSTVSTKDIIKGRSMFLNNTTIKRIPFSLNFRSNVNDLTCMFYNTPALTYAPNFDPKSSREVPMNSMFSGTGLKTLPYVYNAYPEAMDYMFSKCTQLRELPDDYFSTWNNSNVVTDSYTYKSYMFEGCYSLRKLPSSLFTFLYDPVGTSSNYAIYNHFTNECWALDEIIDMPVSSSTITSNVFSYHVDCCSRLKRYTFKMNEDGTPKTAKWKNQTLKIASYLGYTSESNKKYILNYNSGITADKEVTDDASYQALKNDPDWFTTVQAYSRYNHDSAVETINSLPDTSAYGTNTIQFRNAGSATDGGAIDTLTAEEIAVASAKGWTVTFV